MRSTFPVLLKMPHVFNLRDVMDILDIDRRAASQQCYRWKNEGFIKPTSPAPEAPKDGDTPKEPKGRSGVFYNVVRNASHQSHLMEALTKSIRYPMIVLGAMSINAGGWTTQMPKIYDIAVPSTRSSRPYPLIEGARILPRPPSWFRAVWGVSSEFAESSIRMAPPEYGLVDAIRSLHIYEEPEGIWLPKTTDLQPFDDPKDVAELCYRAALEIGFPPEQVKEYLDKIPFFEGEIEDASIEDVREAYASSKMPLPEAAPGDGTLEGLRAYVEKYDIACVVIGESSLSWGDYKTMQGRPTEIAVLEGQMAGMPETEGVVFVERSQEWLDIVLPVSVDGWAGITTAPPAHALVDIISNSDDRLYYRSEHVGFCPSDICLYVMDDIKMIKDCYEAALDLKVSTQSVRHYLSHIQELVYCIDKVKVPEDGQDLPAAGMRP